MKTRGLAKLLKNAGFQDAERVAKRRVRITNDIYAVIVQRNDGRTDHFVLEINFPVFGENPSYEDEMKAITNLIALLRTPA